ncbi:MAG TPA: DUF362 domain-containing protein [Thermoanaerobacterales bacterium]|nr:DUF362 domain-containing protein [Thermoanaerobacterales bacterium]
MAKVAVFKCEDYNAGEILKKLKLACKMLNVDFSGKERILLKPNLLMRKKPEDAVTTHPEVVEATVELLKESGLDAVLADSPGGTYTKKRLEGIYASTGMKGVCDRTGALLNYDTSWYELNFEQGRMLKRIPFISPLRECDGLISLAKLKTHGMAVYTGAVKNLFGLIPGGQKIELHFKMQQLDRFMDMLLDIYLASRPMLSVIDGIVAMEGSGPSAGVPRKLGVLIVSQDGIAADFVASKIIGLKINDFPLLKCAVNRGLFREDEVEIVGDKLEEIMVKDFKFPGKKDVLFLKGLLPAWFENYIKGWLTPKPVFIHKKCIGCRECFNTCPAHAIMMLNKKPVVDLDRCIRCFCCHELCPEKAINIDRAFIFKTILK